VEWWSETIGWECKRGSRGQTPKKKALKAGIQESWKGKSTLEEVEEVGKVNSRRSRRSGNRIGRRI